MNDPTPSSPHDHAFHGTPTAHHQPNDAAPDTAPQAPVAPPGPASTAVRCTRKSSATARARVPNRAGTASCDRGHDGRLPIRAIVALGALFLAIGGAAAADAFVNAIGRGDRATVRNLLLPDVLIFESGGAEQSADEYATHHLPADIRFMAGMKRDVQSRHTGGDQTTRWVATRARIRGTYKEKAVDLDSTETFILRLTDAGWRIAHIHWSSSAHRVPSPTT